MQPIRFPVNVNDPWRLFFWTVDQVAVFSFCFLIGIATDYFVSAVLVGIVLANLFTRYRDSRPDGFVQHLLHWHGMSAFKGRSALNPFIRRIYPA